jgi:hypothetical protein
MVLSLPTSIPERRMATPPDRDIHDKRATARDWELIFATFHRQIPPYTA